MSFDPMARLGRPATIVDVLRGRAARHPDKTAYIYLSERGAPERLTYAELDARARAVAQLLQERDLAGRSIVLAMPAGLDFVAAFFGALYARSLAVPVALPRLAKHADAERRRLIAILERSDPGALLTTEALLPLFEAASEASQLPLVPNLTAADALDPSRADAYRLDPAKPAEVAVVQYTSGSTSAPRGVLVTHRNVLSNMRMIAHAIRADPSDVIGGWVPHFHDMGLFGIMLQPLYLGVPAVLMSPIQFMRRPVSWLRAIGQHRLTVTAAPSFAYERCAMRASDDDVASLDLSSLRVAMDGAEPVRLDVHRRFAARFEPAGFDRRAFVPCYGLAESTLFVSGGPVGRLAPAHRVATAALARGRSDAPLFDEPAIEVASCGQVAAGSTVRVVDPVTFDVMPPGRVGEIWVHGPHVARGYAGAPTASQETFEAWLGAEGPFLRTGDLGFLDDGELYVTGRLKDLIVIRGRNHYPQDLEATVADALGLALTRVGVVEAPGRDGVIVVLEAVDRDAQAVAEERVAAALFDVHGVATKRVEVIGRREMPRTTSGKKQRGRLLQAVHAAIARRTLGPAR